VSMLARLRVCTCTSAASAYHNAGGETRQGGPEIVIVEDEEALDPETRVKGDEALQVRVLQQGLCYDDDALMASRRRTRGVFAFEVRNGVAESERWRDDGEKEHRAARLRTHLQQGRLSE
jgi:hypothetical protein